MTTSTPMRLHHHAWTVDDQEANRRFYEDVIGLPLVATWSEVEEVFGAERTYVHTFYGLPDGSALAFFQYADPKDQEEFTLDRRLAPGAPPRSHVALKLDKATQDGIHERLVAAGHGGPGTFVMDHGYCVSLYTTDPNGLMLEFTVDHPDVEKIMEQRRETAHADLARWLAGDHTPDNPWR